MSLSPDRADLYDRLREQTSNTPLHRLEYIDVPNDCTIFCKEEYRNPTNSHYDRQTLALLRYLEGEADEPLRISPDGLPLVETTTGSSGASFAWLCRVLGYHSARIFIPEDMPNARIRQIEAYGANIDFTPPREYIGGLVRFFRKFSKENRDLYDLPDHSMDTIAGPAAAAEMALEILEEVKKRSPARRPPVVDYFVVALGNGVSARGVADALEPGGTRLIGVEPYESPTVLRNHFPEKYEEQYPQDFEFASHHVYGTGPGDDPIEFPNIEALKGRLDDILVAKEEDWAAVHRLLMDTEAKHVGNSSAACVWAALEIAKQAPAGSVICTVFYDAAWRYLPIE